MSLCSEMVFYKCIYEKKPCAWWYYSSLIKKGENVSLDYNSEFQKGFIITYAPTAYHKR